MQGGCHGPWSWSCKFEALFWREESWNIKFDPLFWREESKYAQGMYVAVANESGRRRFRKCVERLSVHRRIATELNDCLSVDEFASELNDCLAVDVFATDRHTFLPAISQHLPRLLASDIRT